MNILQPIKRFFGFPQANAPPVHMLPSPTRYPPMPEVKPAKQEILINEIKGNEMNLLNLLKAIFEIVKLIEAALPDSPGKEKFAAAMELINDKAGEAVAAMPVVATFVNGCVNVLNILGIFRKKTTAV